MDMERGFRFHPTNMEIDYYLRQVFDAYKFEPWYLPSDTKFSGPSDDTWWFFNRPKKGRGKSGAQLEHKESIS